MYGNSVTIGTLKNTLKTVNLSIPDGHLMAHLSFSAESCEVVVGVVLQKAAECHILTMTCQTIVMNMEVLGLF